MPNINAILKDMRKAGKQFDNKGKGDKGEEAVVALVSTLRPRCERILHRGYMYPYASDRSGKNYVGNIFYKDGEYSELTDKVGLRDEIDVLYITPYRIFPIEVKSYHAKIELYDDWMKYQGEKVEKSTIAQAEKHARHLYHQIYEYIPDGNPKYIKPIACFVDRCTVTDNRSAARKEYIPACILNNLRATVQTYDFPLEHRLDLEAINKKLNDLSISTTLI